MRPAELAALQRAAIISFGPIAGHDARPGAEGSPSAQRLTLLPRLPLDPVLSAVLPLALDPRLVWSQSIAVSVLLFPQVVRHQQKSALHKQREG
jgi:hypothetical protein